MSSSICAEDKQTSFEDLQAMAKRMSGWKYWLFETTFIWSLIMIAAEPTSKWRIMRWYSGWILTGALAASKSKLDKALSIALGLAISFSYPTTHPYLRVVTQMKSCLFGLRLVEVLMKGKTVFEKLGSGFSARFILLHHDLRRSRLIKSEEEKDENLRDSLNETVVAGIRFLWTITIFYKMKSTLCDPPLGANPITQVYPRIVARSYMGALRLWVLISVMDSCYKSHLALYGIEAQKTMDKPHLSKTIREFFGKRWNLGHGRELSDVFFKPLAARGHRQLGEICVFAASVWLHVYFVRVLGASKKLQLSTMLFFSAQLGLIQLERLLKLSGHLYFHSAMFFLGPLWFEPLFYCVPPF